MLKIIGMNQDSEVVLVKNGHVLYVKFIVGETVEGLATVDKLEKGGVRLSFVKDAVLVVDGLYDNYKTVKHLRFARVAQGQNPYAKVTKWPKLRAALKFEGVPTIHVPGGLDKALLYRGEILVADYSMSGSRGWIINRNEIDRYLKALPKIEDSGVMGQVWINFVGWMNLPDECSIDILDHDPTAESAPVFYDRAAGQHRSSNHQIFRIEYDRGSLVIKRIVNQTLGTEVEVVGYSTFPTSRYATVGKRLPSGMRFEEA